MGLGSAPRESSPRCSPSPSNVGIFAGGGVVNLYSIQAGREADVIDPVDTRAEQAFHLPGVILKCGFYVVFFFL